MATQDFSRFHSRLEISGRLELKTPLRIGGGGGADEIGGADITVVKDAAGRPYIPGSSFKGVLRSYVERVLRTIDEELACLCVTPQPDHACPTPHDQSYVDGLVAELKKEEGAGSEDDAPYLDKVYLDKSCPICEVFGSPGLASKVRIPDLTLDGEWAGRYEIRHGVAIDRDTETAAEAKLFTSEAVPAGTVFECQIIVENGSDADQGLVLLGLRAFEDGRLSLGGGASRGFGQVKLEITGCRGVDGDDPTALLDYLVSGEGRAVDEEARLEKIARLRQELEV